MKKLFLLLGISFVLMSGLGCSLTPPNVEVCTELVSGEAFCAYTLEDRERIIPAEEWKAMQIGRFSIDAEGFAQYHAFVQKACEVAKCTKKEKKAQEKALRKMESFLEVENAAD